MSKGGGQGSFAQMQEPGMSMDMSGFGGGGPQPFTGYTPPQTQPMQMEEPVSLGIADNLNTGFIPYSPNNAFGGPGKTVIENMRMNEVSGPAGPDPLSGVDLNRFSGGLGSKGGRSNPYQTDGIVPPGRTAGLPNQTGEIVPDFMLNRSLGGPKGGGRVYAGGTPNFDERTGEYRTGGIKPPRGPVKLEPIKMQPMPMPAPDIPPPERMDVPAIPDDMLADIESRGTVGPGGGTRDRTGSFRDAIREFRDDFRFQPMPRPRPRPEPPIFGPPRNFPFPMPRPPRMPPRQPPRMPGRNTQFQMPFFGSPYGRMNPYAGQFSGYGVPSNMFSFAQPHYQPYVPPPPAQSAPPVMQLPPDQGNQLFGGTPVAYTPPAPVAFGGGFGGQGIGGFGRYNLGLAGRQFRGR